MPAEHPAHGDDHAYSHAGHSHGVTEQTNKRRLTIALGLIVAFMCGEVVAGILANSLALLSDAGHMLTDAGAIGLSLFALRPCCPAGRRQPDLRAEAGGDPVRAGERRNVARARSADRLRGDPAARHRRRTFTAGRC